MDGHKQVYPLQCPAEKQHPGDAVQEEPAPHIQPPQGEDGNVQKEIERTHRKRRDKIVYDNGYAGKSDGA